MFYFVSTTSGTTVQNDDSSSIHSTCSTLASSMNELLTSSDGELSNGSDRTWTFSSYIKHLSDSLDVSSYDDSVKSSIENVSNIVTPTNNDNDDLLQDAGSVVNDMVFAIEQDQDIVKFNQVQELSSILLYYEKTDIHVLR